MNRSFTLGLSVFVVVIVVGVIDIVTAIRVDRLLREIVRLDARIDVTQSTQYTDRVNTRVELDNLRAMDLLVEARLRKHLGHPMPRRERAQPVPAFR